MRIFALCTVSFALAFSSPSAAAVVVKNVNCASGEKIQKALNQSDRGRRLILKIGGTCTEDVVIRRNGVTLRGGGTLKGRLTILSANGIFLTKMTFTGDSSYAVIADIGSAVRIDDIDVRDYKRLGIYIARGSAALIENSRVVHAETATGFAAVLAADGSSIHLRNNVIRSDSPTPGVALAAARGSAMRVDGGNKITNSTAPDTNVFRSLAIMAIDGSDIRIQGAGNVVTGNIDVNSNSSADVRAVTISGKVRVANLSYFSLHWDGAKVMGDVNVSVRSVFQSHNGSGGITGSLDCSSGSAAVVGANVIVSNLNCPTP